MTLIPPNVAALIEAGSWHADNLAEDGNYEAIQGHLRASAIALEAAYATPARSLPTVEEVACNGTYECRAKVHGQCYRPEPKSWCCEGCRDRWEARTGEPAQNALLAREGEAEK